MKSNSQMNDMHVLLVDDNDINLQVCYLTAKLDYAKFALAFCISVPSICSLCLTRN